ncbi:MAG TPA: FtsX-like permease family protein, partial [Acidimicrobiales bacterium]
EHGPQVDIGTPEANVAATQRTMDLETNATWVIVGVLALVALLLAGQLLLRQATNMQTDTSRLVFLGLRRRDVVRLGAVRAAIVGLVAAMIAVSVAVLASPLTPAGLARKAEPDPGFWIDWTVLSLGVVFVVAACTGLGALGTWAVHRQGVASRRNARRWLPLPGGRAPVIIGTHFLTRPARAGEARSARTTALALALVLVLLVGTSTVLQSLTRLSDDQVLSGSSWNGVLQPKASGGEEPTEEDVQSTLEQVRAHPIVTAASLGGWVSVTVGGREMSAQVFEDGGQIQPVIAKGRVPTTAGEIAMGSDEMHRLGVGIGSTVEVQGRQDGELIGEPVSVRIVGQSVLRKPIFLFDNVGDGIAMPNATAQLLQGEAPNGMQLVLARFQDGITPEAGVAQLGNDLPDAVEFAFSSADRSITAGVERVKTLPRVLLAILVVACGAGLTHLLVTSLRRRRRDLAVARTMGLTPRGAAQTLAVQALGFTMLALVPGIVLGLVAGRLFWRLFTSWLGVVTVVVMSPLWLVAIAVGVIVLGQLATLVPAWRAARIKPAELLRAD